MATNPLQRILRPSSAEISPPGLELDPDKAERGKRARNQWLNTVQVPLLRFVGFGLLAGAVWFYNRWFADPPEPASIARSYALVVALYGIFAAIALRFFWARFRGFDLGMVFLVLDVFFMTGAVYATGGERSWLLSILMLRVADQAISGARRALAFGHLTVACLLVMILYLGFVEERPLDWVRELSKLVLIYAGNLYIAVTALAGDARRRKLAAAIQVARKSLRGLTASSLRLARAKTRAEAASEAKDQFLANMSHEMRTPLNAVVGFSELLLGEPLSASQRARVELIATSADSLRRLVDDILELASSEAGQLKLEPSECDPSRQVDEVLKRLAGGAEAKKLRLTHEVEASLPRFEVDAARLQQVLAHLIGNAVKFTPKGGRVSVRVAAAASPAGERIRFEIEDTGIGVAPRDRESVFEPFFQADASMTRAYGGAGIGLTLSKRLVEEMGGRIGFDTESGQGSTFWFDLPLAPAAQENEEEP